MNHTNHEQFQQEIAGYLAGRLSDDESAELRAHIGSCEECAELVEAWAPAVAGFQFAGAEILTPHPSSVELLRYARGEEQAGEVTVRHLETCPTCSLEVEGARAGSVVREIRPASKITRYVSMGLAAGLLLGLGLANLVRTPEGRSALGPGATQLYTLDQTVRSSDDATVLDVDRDSTVLPLVLIPAIPDDASPDDSFRIELRDEDGEAAWSGRFTTGELNRYLEISGVLTLLVPAQPDGVYTLQLLPEGSPGDEPIQEFRFKVRQR